MFEMVFVLSELLLGGPGGLESSSKGILLCFAMLGGGRELINSIRS